MKTKKLLMLLLTALILISTTRINVFAKESVDINTQTTAKASYTKTDLRILTAITYCEAGYEGYEAKLGVANVVLNRVDSEVFDHVTTVKEAVYDLKRWGRQFSPAYVKTSSGKYTTKGSLLEAALKLYTSGEYKSDLQERMMKECEKAAIEALEGANNIGDYLYFNANVSATKERCKKNNKPYTVIDSTIFY